jgi:hypothetical protein
MNHQKVYQSIIENAKSLNRIKFKKTNKYYIYYEKHHIIPKCLGGNNDKENLVLLTAREHYICHKLLTYMYRDNKSLVYAFHRMTFDKISNRKISSRDYAYEKEIFNLIPMFKSQETKEKFSKARKGKSYDEFYKEKSSYMKNKRKDQTTGKNNPNARLYIIYNQKLCKTWFCHGNLGKFGKEYHVSGRTFILSRKYNTYINNWKCEIFDQLNENHKNYIMYK